MEISDATKKKGIAKDWRKYIGKNNFDILNKVENGRQYLPSDGEIEGAVLSLDIRNSTELMNQATQPGFFVETMTEILESTRDAIHEEYGIIEKFTGDGILAYFPKNYTGGFFVHHAIVAAINSISAFSERYARNFHKFESPIAETGFAAGVASGKFTLANILNTRTIVGRPVVAACRLNGGQKGEVWISAHAEQLIRITENSEAFEIAKGIFSSKDGPFHAARVTISNLDECYLDDPPWIVEVRKMRRVFFRSRKFRRVRRLPGPKKES